MKIAGRVLLALLLSWELRPITAAAGERDPNTLRYVFLVDTSAAMAPYKTVIANAVAFGLQHEAGEILRNGDLCAVWTYDQTVATNRYLPITWQSRSRGVVASRMRKALSDQVFAGEPKLSEALPELSKLISASESFTAVIIHDGREILPAEVAQARANGAAQSATQLARQLSNPVYATTLQARFGQVTECSTAPVASDGRTRPFPGHVQEVVKRPTGLNYAPALKAGARRSATTAANSRQAAAPIETTAAPEQTTPPLAAADNESAQPAATVLPAVPEVTIDPVQVAEEGTGVPGASAGEELPHSMTVRGELPVPIEHLVDGDTGPLEEAPKSEPVESTSVHAAPPPIQLSVEPPVVTPPSPEPLPEQAPQPAVGTSDSQESASSTPETVAKPPVDARPPESAPKPHRVTLAAARNVEVFGSPSGALWGRQKYLFLGLGLLLCSAATLRLRGRGQARPESASLISKSIAGPPARTGASTVSVAVHSTRDQTVLR